MLNTSTKIIDKASSITCSNPDSSLQIELYDGQLDIGCIIYTSSILDRAEANFTIKKEDALLIKEIINNFLDKEHDPGDALTIK